MVLIRVALAAVALVVVVGGCSESVFGNRRDPGGGSGGGSDGGITGDGGGGGDDASLPSVCPAPCITDAALAFDGSASGIDGYWRYYEDLRELRMWTAMAAAAMARVGSDAGNRITSCAARPEAPACTLLPGGLLVSAAGIDATADPAIAFVARTAQVLELRLRAAVPAGAEPTIHVYRNSREDVLFSGTAAAGAVFEQTITVDVLAEDRVLVAVVPSDETGATDVGLGLTVSAAASPSSCQLAVGFEVIADSSITDVACQAGRLVPTGEGAGVAPVQVNPPFVELRHAIRMTPRTWLQMTPSTTVVDYTRDVTVQLWASERTAGSSFGWLYSDLGAAGGGLAIAIIPTMPANLQVAVGSGPDDPSGFALTTPYETPGVWHFIRVVRTADTLHVCIDGQYAASLEMLPGPFPAVAPALGKHTLNDGEEVVFDGSIDDLRVFTGALPCAPPLSPAAGAQRH